MKHQKTVFALYQSHAAAQSAVSDLVRAGFSTDDIGVLAQDTDGHYRDGNVTTDKVGNNAGRGAAAGVAAGATGGALWAVGIAAGILPAIGPVVAGGALAAVVASAAGGAAVAGMTGALIGAGIPKDRVAHYESEIEKGRVLVTVRTEDPVKASDILQSRTPPHSVEEFSTPSSTVEQVATKDPYFTTTPAGKRADTDVDRA